MAKQVSINGRTYVVSNELKVSFSAGDWERAKQRYRKQVANRLADEV